MINKKYTYKYLYKLISKIDKQMIEALRVGCKYIEQLFKIQKKTKSICPDLTNQDKIF